MPYSFAPGRAARARAAVVFCILCLVYGSVWNRARPAWAQDANDTPGAPPYATAPYAAAFAFMLPRILQPVPLPQLVMWGLHGLTTIDPSLQPDLQEDGFRLMRGDRIVFHRNVPPADDITGWGALVQQTITAAQDESAIVRAVDRPAMVSTFFNELFSHLDPYSRYVPPDDATGDRARRSGTVAGVVLAAHRHGVKITEVLADGPGSEAGLRIGDTLLSVGGVRLRHGLDEALRRLQGPEGSTVVLTVRGQDGVIDQVEVLRKAMPPETVFARIEGDLLFIRITGFSEDTDDRLGSELARAFAEKKGPGPTGVILDLRGNRGGLLRQAADVTSRLLDGGLVATTSGRDSEAEHRFTADSGGDETNGRPIVVLVDGRSASAAEIVAAALADNRRAVVVGSSTLGKGLVQTIGPLPDGGELFVTWSRVIAPRGWPIQGLGVMPQLCTGLGRDVMLRQLAALAGGSWPMRDAVSLERATRSPLPASQIVELRTPCPAAEGRDMDLEAARFLLHHPDAYAAAVLPPVLP